MCCHGFDVVHDLVLGQGLPVLGCVERGFGLCVDLDVGLEPAIWFGPRFCLCRFFSLFSCCVIACISMFLNSQDQMHHHCIPCTHQHCIPCTPELISTKEQNARLLEEIRKHKVERDSYILERDLQYEQMRKELEIQMEVYKGKVIELQIENYLVKADLELITNKA